jgi:hypothetical protein
VSQEPPAASAIPPEVAEAAAALKREVEQAALAAKLAKARAEAKVWRSNMRRWALEWRASKTTPQPTIARRPPWKYSAHYQEMRYQAAGNVAGASRKGTDNTALAAAIRCRNRSLGVSPF